MMPALVLTMTMPSPPSTRGMSVLRAYTRRPGLLMRLRPETTGTLPSTYLRVRRRTAAGPSCSSMTSAMKPSSLRMRAISRFVRDAGTTTSVWRARDAFRTRVSMSAIGSEMFIRSSYQLDFVTPGSSPRSARSRKQMRHSANRRMKARGRPHTVQRWYACTLCFGLRPALAIIDFLAMVLPPPRLRREGHAEELEELLRFLVGLRRRHDADLQPAETVHLVVIDLGECELLAHPE